MSEPATVKFVLDGSIAGKRISPAEGLPFAQFQEFNNDVQEFVLGSEHKTALNNIQVQIKDSSYGLLLAIPSGMLGSLVVDAARLAQPDALGEMDAKRALVILRWQEKARTNPSLAFSLQSPSGAFPSATINSFTEYRMVDKAQWVKVERYLVGKITDWGGEPTSNVHLRVRNSGKIIIIATDEAHIRGKKNLVYERAIVRVEAKENLKTGELKDLRLVDMWMNERQIDETRLQQLLENGRKSWADVPDAGAWVEELRGGTHA